MLLVHRRTLHAPFAYSLVALAALGLGVATGWPLAILVGVALAAAALHSAMDVLGGGKEMRPWRETDDRAVYDHLHGRWLRARRLFYDGSAPDFAIAAAAGVVVALRTGGAWRPVVAGLLVAGLVYTLVRRRLAAWLPEEHATFSAYLKQALGLD
jgi:hypothetical protein